MTGQKLHRYDVQLCNHVVGHFRDYMRDRNFLLALEKFAWSELFNYFQEGFDLDLEPRYLLLHEDELEHLVEACRVSVGRRRWESCDDLLRRSVNTIVDVNKGLSQNEGEKWSRKCDLFARRLMAPRLTLAEGIEITREWVHEIRRLLKAMDAGNLLPCPEGRSPTPTNPAPAALSSTPTPDSAEALSPSDQDALERLRQAIRETQNGKYATARLLIKKAGIRNKKGRDLLRLLESQDEYKGFDRRRPEQYKTGQGSRR
jgi:hypothetical protein